MTKSEDTLKRNIEDIFSAKVVSCDWVRSFALRVKFKSQHDLGTALSLGGPIASDIQRPSDAQRRMYHNAELYALSQNAPLIVFENALLSTQPNGTTSQGSGYYHPLQQDPPHHDTWEGKMDTSSFLHKPLSVSRLAPTYFILPQNVKPVISQMLETCLSDAVREALLAMTDDEYCFSLGRTERETRRTVLRSYHDFTDVLFRDVPSDCKYAHAWQAGESTVTLHCNDGNKMLHGRPGSDDQTNHVSVCDLYPG